MRVNCRFIGEERIELGLINDEKEFGITVHYIDDGVDTGDIIRNLCIRLVIRMTMPRFLKSIFRVSSYTLPSNSVTCF